ncbi:hypothetical protein PITCH_A350056 [uncultured Desulfobacterium sp.]|uniref:Uncharacterized protein n=1 Tax=uncultured Desulfobacterium sp. TaxID=201089 RepID=A0A445MZD3_9BACT|nr:hypothetical protein PITCH_A350056 [uncultured Desulfobacterium sp.]
MVGGGPWKHIGDTRCLGHGLAEDIHAAQVGKCDLHDEDIYRHEAKEAKKINC